MEPLKTYRGTLHRGQLVTEVPLPDESPLQVMVTLIEDTTVDSMPLATIQPPNSLAGSELRSAEQYLYGILSRLPNGLLQDVLDERNAE